MASMTRVVGLNSNSKSRDLPQKRSISPLSTCLRAQRRFMCSLGLRTAACSVSGPFYSLFVMSLGGTPSRHGCCMQSGRKRVLSLTHPTGSDRLGRFWAARVYLRGSAEE
jgi:hypothetical protein